MGDVRLVSVTASHNLLGSELGPEEIIAWCARVSAPENQDKHDTAPKLMAYLIKNKHWSPFEMADMTVEIKTSRAIATQILRHRSFSFQEYSQRYAKANHIRYYGARRQDLKNKQNSTDDLSPDVKEWFFDTQDKINNLALSKYQEALDKGIAKECARFILPLSTETTLCMKGSVRSWIHYLELRTGNGTQLEHKEIADEIMKIFKKQFPNVSKAMNF